ncbi:DUF1624 domain-containing protein [Flaviaesturariibacter aridisoli]|uniref:DUF1624 domain-containing protein n=1 Tax=Flaviaesturariibacter aridisoli TaxID=2545761 RepID=A0A4R4E7N0_9BACT|nr:heparan-alpha-glucosaminide N-acetyltransferase domain-containing protein [Flaviaesturariibacter aridisoli]TCZ74071.1 DUF1624 domain-containing protein [Flaviaesturariibacter aridisoli]
MNRIRSLDIVRGLVMIIMALDHTRDLLHVSSITQQPTDLATTTPALFFTRWITHLCAPTFVFLSGASAFLSLQRRGDRAAARRFLFTRGLSLILLEFTLVNFGIWFDIRFGVLLFDVIATIGTGFIVLGLLLNASVRTIAIIGLSIIFLHDAALMLPIAEGAPLKKILMPLFGPAAYSFGAGRTFVMGYPPIPWLGILLTGFAAGRLFLRSETDRKRLFVRIGLASLALFFLLRGLNVYGDTVPWEEQKNTVFTILSFLNVSKYPPSLSFTLAMLGIMFLLLAATEGARGKGAAIAIVYGRVPLFYFIVHWYLIHPILFVIIALQGYRPVDYRFGFNFGRPEGPSGVSLGWIYVLWIVVVIALWPLCRWYDRYKTAHPEKGWVRYL